MFLAVVFSAFPTNYQQFKGFFLFLDCFIIYFILLLRRNRSIVEQFLMLLAEFWIKARSIINTFQLFFLLLITLSLLLLLHILQSSLFNSNKNEQKKTKQKTRTHCTLLQKIYIKLPKKTKQNTNTTQKILRKKKK